jgi:hypothetical protein
MTTRLTREDASDGTLAGKAEKNSGTTVTELVYRHQLRPVIQTGATVMDQLFSANRRPAD